MGDRLWNKLHNLETEIKNFKSQTILSASFSVDNNEDNEFMGLFPISSIETFNNCEYILNTDNRIEEKLVVFYPLIKKKNSKF